MPANLKKLTRTSAIALAAATAFVCSAITTGQAADDLYDPGVTEVEFGTGWYIRGDIGFTGHEVLRNTEQAGNAPIAPVVETTDTNNVFSVGVGFGRRLTSNLRADIGYGYLADSETSMQQTVTSNFRAPCANAFALVTVIDQNGNAFQQTVGGQTIENCVEAAQTSYFLQSLSANGYYDFDTSLAGFRPFVGLGAGLIRAQYTSTSNDVTCSPGPEERCNPTDGSPTPLFGEVVTQQFGRNNGTSYHLAGSVSAGLSYAITDTLFFDTTYQYTHMFDDPLWGGSDGIEAANIPTDFHTLKFGIRMEIW